MRRLLWGGGVALALLASVALGLLLQKPTAGDAAPTLAGATSPTAVAVGPAATTPTTALPNSANTPPSGPTPGPDGFANDPTAALGQTVPTPVPLDRAMRDPSAGARLTAAQAAATLPVGAAAAGADGSSPISVVDANGRTGTAELHGAAVSEADLGIRLAPGSRVDPSAGSRVREPSGGETVMVVVSSSDTTDRLAAHYRAQLQATAGGAAVQSYTPGPGQLLLQSVNPSTGVNRAVLIAPQSAGAVTVTLVRAQPAPGATGP